MATLKRTCDILLIIIAVGVLAALAPSPAAPTTVAAADLYGCDRIAAYQAALFETMPVPETPAEARVVEGWFDGTIDTERLRPSQAAALASYIDRWATELEDMPSFAIPPAAEAHHAALVDLMSVMAGAMQAYATTGAFGLLPYAEAIEESTADMDAAMRQGETRCGAQWTAVFGETEPVYDGTSL